MIKKSILTAFALLGVYHFLLPHISHRFYQINGQQRGNYLRMQRYLYNAPNNANVIVGSSLANMLSDEVLGSNYFKLALPGGSVFTGLETVRRTAKQPAVLLIETNVILKDPDKELLDDLFSPLLNPLRRGSRIFREEGRPSNFVAAIAEACVRRSCQLCASLLGRKGQESDYSLSQKPVDPAVRSRVLLLQRELSSHAPSPEELAIRVNKLAGYVDSISQAGGLCVFFEMPIDDSLTNLPLETSARRAVKERFPQDKYHWIAFPHDHNYETIDGLHLTFRETRGVTQNLIAQVNQLTNERTALESNPPTASRKDVLTQYR